MFLCNKISLLHRPFFTITYNIVSYSPLLSQACFQPQNISYPQLPSPERKGPFYLGRLRFSDWGGSRSFMVRWVKILFWFLDLYRFQKGAIKVDYNKIQLICISKRKLKLLIVEHVCRVARNKMSTLWYLFSNIHDLSVVVKGEGVPAKFSQELSNYGFSLPLDSY